LVGGQGFWGVSGSAKLALGAAVAAEADKEGREQRETGKEEKVEEGEKMKRNDEERQGTEQCGADVIATRPQMPWQADDATHL
jgi:hypothetical protein